ncbi:preprotein translocase subunit SecY [Candidatus Gracilibacteria bacterium]|nr:preprotein translocase subunit SecY [Candidatus Gracilibacteria bacterium]
MIASVKKIWATEHIRKKILFTLGIIAVYKLLATIPVPGVNVGLLEEYTKLLQANTQLAFFGSIMGGGLESFSIILMGLAPFINATIIIQLLAVIVPSLEALKKEGEQGQKKLNNYTRYLTVPLALAQSYGMIFLLNTLVGTGGTTPIIDTKDFLGTVLPAMIFITSGTMILLWLGDLITESGIGNGSSIIIFAGVLAAVPNHILGYITAQTYGLLAFLAVLTVLVIYIIVKFTEGYRKVPLIYTRTGRDERSYFPIRVNQAGMVPIIFAVALITFPALIGQLLARRSDGGQAQEIGNWLVANLSMQNPGWIYIAVYALLVLGFAFFYVSITFNTTEVSESIQKRGGYIPGIRPGVETAKYLQSTSDRLNLFGGGFLALIAVFPYLMTKINNQFGLFDMTGTSQIDFLISGAGLIIVVGVILDIIRRIDTDMKSFDYKKFH